jgi:hypothetical protein
MLSLALKGSEDGQSIGKEQPGSIESVYGKVEKYGLEFRSDNR